MDNKTILIKMREEVGLNKTEMAKLFQIPFRTYQEWELGNRNIQPYLLRLMVYYMTKEKMIETIHIEDIQED